MIQGITINNLLTIREVELDLMLPAFNLDKSSISKSLIKSIYWAMSLTKNPLKPSREKMAKILKVSEKLQQNEDKSLSNTAREVVKLCKNQLS
jgi:hypothetical protein